MIIETDNPEDLKDFPLRDKIESDFSGDGEVMVMKQLTAIEVIALYQWAERKKASVYF